MSLAALEIAAALFGGCLALHLLLWRFRPLRRIPVLFAVFLAPLPAVLTLMPAPLSLAVCLAHLALSCAYLQTYPALVPAAPTLRILLLVAAGEPKGVTAEQVSGAFGSQGLVAEALEPLLAGDLLRRRPGSEKLEITGRGRALVWPFLLLRKIIGLPPGAG